MIGIDGREIRSIRAAMPNRPVTAADAARQRDAFLGLARMLGTLGTPRSLRLDEIGDDYLLGVFRDSLDVEHVRMHRISKPRGR